MSGIVEVLVGVSELALVGSGQVSGMPSLV